MVSMGTVWDRTTEFLSDNLGAILPIALIGIYAPSVGSSLLAELQHGAGPGVRAGLNLGALVLALVSFWAQLAIIAVALDPAQARAAWGAAARRVPMAVLIMVLMFVAALVAVMPFGIILAFSGADLSVMASGGVPQVPAAAGGAMALYGLALVAVLLWVVARLAVVLPAIVGERLGLGAIGRSWRLTRGLALKIIGVLILYVVVSVVATSAVQLGVGSVLKLVLGSGPGITLAAVLTALLVAAVSTIFSVLVSAFSAKLFIALLVREEAVRAQ